MEKTLMNNVQMTTGWRNATEEPGGPIRPMMVGHVEIELMVLEKLLLQPMLQLLEQPCELLVPALVVKLSRTPL